MLATSVVRPLAGGARVLVSAWRDIHEGARAHLLHLPGICRIDVSPVADSLSIRFVNDPAVSLHPLRAGTVQSADLEIGGADVRDVRQFAQQHFAFRALASDRSVDVSMVVGITWLHDEGIARLSAQAILADSGA